VKAAHTDRSLSGLVNTAVRQALAEDAQDLAIFAARAKEPVLSFEELLKDLKRRAVFAQPLQRPVSHQVRDPHRLGSRRPCIHATTTTTSP
jgi:hypothetical protein